MFHRILVPLDGSPLAEQVLPLVQAFTERFSSSVVLFRVVAPVYERVSVGDEVYSPAEQVDLLQESARRYLESMRCDLSAANVQAQAWVDVGSPATSILVFAENTHADLIAMVTHGLTGLQRWAFGSVADKVLSGTRTPLLLVRACESPLLSPRIRRILVPLDGSALAERALPTARQLALAFGADVHLFRAWENPLYRPDAYPIGISPVAFGEAIGKSTEEYLQQAAEEFMREGPRVHSESRCVPAAEGILEAIHKREADLVVMCTHGRSGVSRWVMGSIADRVLRASPIPVLLIRSRAAAPVAQAES